MNKKLSPLFVIVLALSCLLSFLLGGYLSSKSVGENLNSTQAMLAFNHLDNYEEIVTCLDKGFTEEAKGKLEHRAISQRELLSDLLREN